MGRVPECPCILVPRILIALGAKNAARMHAKGYAPATIAQAIQDNRDHMTDEERYFFPVMLEIARDCAANREPEEADSIVNVITRLGREHGVVRRDYLDKGLLPPPALTSKHGKAEDALIVKWSPEIEQSLLLRRRAAA
jgi:hypothetical protein